MWPLEDTEEEKKKKKTRKKLFEGKDNPYPGVGQAIKAIRGHKKQIEKAIPEEFKTPKPKIRKPPPGLSPFRKSVDRYVEQAKQAWKDYGG